MRVGYHMQQEHSLPATVLFNVHAEAVLQEGPDHQTAFNLVLCAAAMGDAELMRQSFQQLLQVGSCCLWENMSACASCQVTWTSGHTVQMSATPPQHALNRCPSCNISCVTTGRYHHMRMIAWRRRAARKMQGRLLSLMRCMRRCTPSRCACYC